MPPEFLVALEQHGTAKLAGIVRATDDVDRVTGAVRDEIRRLDPELPPRPYRRLGLPVRLEHRSDGGVLALRAKGDQGRPDGGAPARLNPPGRGAPNCGPGIRCRNFGGADGGRSPCCLHEHTDPTPGQCHASGVSRARRLLRRHFSYRREDDRHLLSPDLQREEAASGEHRLLPVVRRRTPRRLPPVQPLPTHGSCRGHPRSG